MRVGGSFLGLARPRGMGAPEGGRGWGAPPGTEPRSCGPGPLLPDSRHRAWPGALARDRPSPGCERPQQQPRETPGTGLQTRSWSSRDHAGPNLCSWGGLCPQLAGHPTVSRLPKISVGPEATPSGPDHTAALQAGRSEETGTGDVCPPASSRLEVTRDPPEEGNPGHPLPARREAAGRGSGFHC